MSEKDYTLIGWEDPDNIGARKDKNGKPIPFTKDLKIEHPGSKLNGETLGQYRKRVDEAVAKGFHLGDLSWSDWFSYCDANEFPDAFESPENEKRSKEDM